MTDNYIQIRQKPNTESLMKEWLGSVPLTDDTLYAILYVPMECPRCEVTIPNFWEMLKKVDARKKMLLITAYPDARLAQDYVERSGYMADAYLFDTSEQYKRIFNTNMTGGLMGLHVLKIDRKTGNLLTGGQNTVLSKLFVRQLINYVGMLEKSTFANESENDSCSYSEVPQTILPLATFKEFEIDSLADISSVYGVPRFIDEHLFFTDVLQNGVMLFRQQENVFDYKGLLQVDSTEKKRFINVPDGVYEHYKKHKMLFYIALGVNLLDDNHIGISYSIPELVPDLNGGEDAYALYNASVVISRNIETMEPDSMFIFDMDLENDTLFFNTHFSFVKHQDEIVIGCKKMTWPMEYDREDYENVPALNPFDSDFYLEETPFSVSFNWKDGKRCRRYGKLDEVHALSRTGYYFTNPIAASFDGELLCSDGYSGKVYIFDGIKEQTFSVFEVDTKTFPKPDTTLFYTYEYAKPYKRVLNRCITDVRFDKKNIYTITKYACSDSDLDARYVYTVIERKNGKVKERIVPSCSGEVVGCGLRLNRQKVSPFVIIKEGGKVVVRDYFTK